ncbi:MAG: hypothetical protein KGI19_05090 [Thaumarchaeota archaeon]|nr:hypothetical protein [Nitrososphaerota archaeon]
MITIKPSLYVRMAHTMLQIIKKARVPPYLHRKSNHVYSVWQHLILLTLRQYKCKSYHRFVEFLQESFGMMQYLGLSKIPHYTTLQKAAARLTHGILIKMLESFVMYTKIRKIFAGIDSTGLSHGQASWYYTKRLKLRRKFVKVSICADMRRQIICGIKIVSTLPFHLPILGLYQRYLESKLIEKAKDEDLIIQASSGMVLPRKKDQKIIIYCHHDFQNETKKDITKYKGVWS